MDKEEEESVKELIANAKVMFMVITFCNIALFYMSFNSITETDKAMIYHIAKDDPSFLLDNTTNVVKNLYDNYTHDIQVHNSGKESINSLTVMDFNFTD